MDSKKILTHTIDIINPTHYISRKFFRNNHHSSESIAVSTFFNALASILAGLTMVQQKPDYEKVNFASHDIKYVIYDTNHGNYDGHAFLHGAKILVSPWWLVYTQQSKPVYTLINNTYRVEGDDIIQFSTDQGYFINKSAFNEREFFIRDKKYNQKELEEELKDLIKDYEDVKENLQSKSKSGNYTSAMKENTEYHTRIRDLRRDIDKVHSAKRILVNSLLSTAKDLNQELYELRGNTEREVEELKQKKLREN